MKEYIEKEAAIGIIKSYRDRGFPMEDADTWEIQDIERLEPADVKPVVRGEWIDGGWEGDKAFQIDGRGNCWHVSKCSVCGFKKKGAQSNFCPNCGAEMREEVKDER